ncbi:MAG: MarR family winged helix-turn-helix transcriptional regulator [Methylocystaceae bacterium]
MEDFTSFICYSLKTTMKKVEKHITQRFDEYGINLAQSFIIFCLLERDGSTLTEIGLRAHIENSSLTTMVDKLEKTGLVERRLDSTDRRVIRVFLTEKGTELGNRVLSEGKEFNDYLRQNLQDMEPTFLEGLQKIARSID